MQLTRLLTGIHVLETYHFPPDRTISGVVCHSAEVKPGHMFVCIKGHRSDGHDYASQAVARGAAALVFEEPLPAASLTGERRTVRSNPRCGAPTGDDPALPAEPAFIRVPHSRLAYALLCANFYERPSQTMDLIGVTGTNGKTTTTHLIEGIYNAAGYATGVVSSVHARVGDEVTPTKLTTPDAGTLQRLLHRMKQRGIQQGVLEVSSHALSQHRVSGCRFRSAVFTNLSRDHLDFHGTWRNYFATKRRLFSMIDEATPKGAIINIDDPWGRRLARTLAPAVVRYGFDPGADVSGTVVHTPSEGLHLSVRTPSGVFAVALPLPGLCNAYNALAAAAVAWAQDIPLPFIRQGLEQASPIPGRFQRVDCGQPFNVYVDFAHNPTGLEQALKALRHQGRGHLWLVFGCKGEDVDAHKRQQMGTIAGALADRIIITTDNVYGEDPEKIVAELVGALRHSKSAAGRYDVVIDRRNAIERALRQAQPGDLVLIAGKGHEGEQIIGESRINFSDARVAADILNELYPERSGTVAAAAGRERSESDV